LLVCSLGFGARHVPISLSVQPIHAFAIFALGMLPRRCSPLSPLGFKHINMLCRLYAFTLSDTVTRGELRPLRDPHTASLEEA
jgi:hypothetical protein